MTYYVCMYVRRLQEQQQQRLGYNLGTRDFEIVTLR